MGLNIKNSICLIFCGLIILGLSVGVLAQFRASIQGTITDSTDAVVVGATVVLTNPATNQTFTTKTNESGFYRFNGLGPGNYNITVTQTNFKKKVIDNFPVGAENTEGLDVKLETGEVSAEVNVSADDSPALNTESGNIGKGITEKEVLTLPQAGRDPYQLARLAPGVMGDGGRSGDGGALRLGNNGSGPGGSNKGIFATENQTQITANGQRVTSNNYEIDGTSVNSQTWGGAAVITPSQETVEAVQVTSSTYSAEDGRNSGAQVRVVTKSGANQWHGSAFFKLNDPSLNAFNTFYGVKNGTNVIVDAKPTRVQENLKTYGGSFGGKLITDKLFFFFAYEGAKTNSNNTYNAIIDTAAFRQSIITSRAGTVSARILATGAEPRIASILTPSCASIFITCNVVGNGMDIGSITGTYGTYVNSNQTLGGGFDGVADLQVAQLYNPYKFNGNQYNVRIDFLPTANDRITFSSNFTPASSTTADTSAQSRPQADINSERLNYAYTGIYSHVFSGSMVNEARFNLTRFGYNELDTNPDANFGLPRIEIEGIFSDRLRYNINRSEATPGIFNEKQFHFKDTLTMVFGNHNLKFGGEYHFDLNSNSAAGGARPLYSFLRPWNFANGTPIFEAINLDANGKPLANDTKIKTGNIGVFIQDDWKFSRNLTLNLGLRWEYFSPISPADGKTLGNLILGSNGLVNAQIETGETLTDKNWTNFAPQLGFAWSPGNFENKLVIRGGAGIGYDRLAFALTQNTRFNPPNAARFGICCGISGQPGDDWSTPFVGGQITYVASGDGTIFGYPANPVLATGFGANGGPKVGQIEIYGVPRDLPNASVYRYSLEGEYQLPAKVVASVGYQGSSGRHFVRILPLHLILPATSSTFNPVYYGSPDVNTNYNALNATVKKRFGSGFDFNVNYRFSKSTDTTSLEAPCGCTNQTYPVDNSTEKGPSDFDVRHFLVASGTWEPQWFKGQNNIGGDLLAGWSFSPIVTWRGGFPFTPVIGNGLRGPNGNFFGPIRPVRFLGGEALDNSNSNFLLPGGIFPGGGAQYFSTTTNVDSTGTPTFQLNPPGIGRNSFRGPRYFSVDLSIAKNFSLAKIGGVFNENSKIDLRFNFFNLLNNLNLAPFGFNSPSTQVTNTQFGVATSALAGRVGEFQIRFSF